MPAAELKLALAVMSEEGAEDGLRDVLGVLLALDVVGQALSGQANQAASDTTSGHASAGTTGRPTARRHSASLMSFPT